jgi:hypothetical protein
MVQAHSHSPPATASKLSDAQKPSAHFMHLSFSSTIPQLNIHSPSLSPPLQSPNSPANAAHLARKLPRNLRNDCTKSKISIFSHRYKNSHQGDSLCNATTLKINTKLNTSTTTGSTLSPGLSSVYSLNIVLLLPPAPAALVLLGLALASLSFWSAAARRRIAVLGPPGGVGEEGRPEGVEAGELTGEEGRGEDCFLFISCCAWKFKLRRGWKRS